MQRDLTYSSTIFISWLFFPPCVVIRGAVLFVPRGTKSLFFVFNLA